MDKINQMMITPKESCINNDEAMEDYKNGAWEDWKND